MFDTVSSVTADMVVGHEGTDDDAEGAEHEEGDGEGDLLDGGLVVDHVGGFHHHVLVRNRERVIHVRHLLLLLLCCSLSLLCFSSFLVLGDSGRGCCLDNGRRSRRRKKKWWVEFSFRLVFKLGVQIETGQKFGN